MPITSPNYNHLSSGKCQMKGYILSFTIFIRAILQIILLSNISLIPSITANFHVFNILIFNALAYSDNHVKSAEQSMELLVKNEN